MLLGFQRAFNQFSKKWSFKIEVSGSTLDYLIERDFISRVNLNLIAFLLNFWVFS